MSFLFSIIAKFLWALCSFGSTTGGCNIHLKICMSLHLITWESEHKEKKNTILNLRKSLRVRSELAWEGSVLTFLLNVYSVSCFCVIRPINSYPLWLFHVRSRVKLSTWRRMLSNVEHVPSLPLGISSQVIVGWTQMTVACGVVPWVHIPIAEPHVYTHASQYQGGLYSSFSHWPRKWDNLFFRNGGRLTPSTRLHVWGNVENI